MAACWLGQKKQWFNNSGELLIESWNGIFGAAIEQYADSDRLNILGRGVRVSGHEKSGWWDRKGVPESK